MLQPQPLWGQRSAGGDDKIANALLSLPPRRLLGLSCASAHRRQLESRMKSLCPQSRTQLRSDQHVGRLKCTCNNLQSISRRLLCRSAVVDVLGPLQLQPQQLRQIEQACGTIPPERLQSNLKELTNVYLLKVGSVVCCSVVAA
jgi:hypothetical protein